MTFLIAAAVALLTVSILAIAGLAAWRGWLDLRRFEIAETRAAGADITDPGPAIRIEMANLKERLRRLEAIAQGVDL